MTITPPANLSTGMIRLQGAGVHIDGPDGDLLPDFKAVTGTITITASETVLRDGTASPNPITLFMRPFVCSLDGNGYLITPDGSPAYQGVKALATDDPDILEIGSWGYRVDFNLEDALGVAQKIDPFYFLLPADTTVDLTTVTRVDPNSWDPLPGPQPAWWLELAEVQTRLDDVETAVAGKVDGLNAVTGLWQGTALEYAAIDTPNANVVYIVED